MIMILLFFYNKNHYTILQTVRPTDGELKIIIGGLLANEIKS